MMKFEQLIELLVSDHLATALKGRFVKLREREGPFGLDTNGIHPIEVLMVDLRNILDYGLDDIWDKKLLSKLPIPPILTIEDLNDAALNHLSGFCEEDFAERLQRFEYYVLLELFDYPEDELIDYLGEDTSYHAHFKHSMGTRFELGKWWYRSANIYVPIRPDNNVDNENEDEEVEEALYVETNEEVDEGSIEELKGVSTEEFTWNPSDFPPVWQSRDPIISPTGIEMGFELRAFWSKNVSGPGAIELDIGKSSVDVYGNVNFSASLKSAVELEKKLNSCLPTVVDICRTLASCLFPDQTSYVWNPIAINNRRTMEYLMKNRNKKRMEREELGLETGREDMDYPPPDYPLPVEINVSDQIKGDPGLSCLFEPVIQEVFQKLIDTYLKIESFSDHKEKDDTLLRMQNALQLLIEAKQQQHTAIALAITFSAIEALICEGKGEITKQLADKLPTLLEPDYRNRESFMNPIRKLYDKRSKLLHGENVEDERHGYALVQVNRLAAGTLGAMIEWRGFQGRMDDNANRKTFLEQIKEAQFHNKPVTGISDNFRNCLP